MAVINVSTVDISAAVKAAMIRPKTPGTAKNSEAIKNAWEPSSSGNTPA